MATVAAGLLLSLLGTAIGAPVSTYDQRQQGELNIHAQLDNIVVVLIPTSNINLLNLAGKNKYKPGGLDKLDFLQIFQKPHKNDIDRYETALENDSPEDNAVKADVTVPVLVEKEDEVVATVEEMKPVSTEVVTDPPKSEATEDSPTKEHSTVGETVQESVLKITVPEKPKEEVKPAEVEVNNKDPVQSSAQDVVNSSSQEAIDSSGDKANQHSDTAKTTVPSLEKEEKLESSTEKKVATPSSESLGSHEPTIKELIKPVAEKEEKTHQKTPETSAASVLTKSAEPVRLVEGVRKEKVIRYKPETKWAPELVDLLGPTRSKPKDLEERRFASLCSPGVWDKELKTCIMPGETRSRSELARFLEAMRFGIAIPAK